VWGIELARTKLLERFIVKRCLLDLTAQTLICGAQCAVHSTKYTVTVPQRRHFTLQDVVRLY
jgi:hypothetical protein